MRALVPEEQLRPKEKDAPCHHDTTSLLNYFFMGLPPSNIAVQMSRTWECISWQLRCFYGNVDGRCDEYDPGRNRIWRGGERLNRADRLMAQGMRNKGVSRKQIAKVLQRSLEELPK